MVAQRELAWTPPAVWSPGEYLVVHWAEATPRLFLFCAVLVVSQWRFVAFATDLAPAPRWNRECPFVRLCGASCAAM
jgi:hypothetical protein